MLRATITLIAGAVAAMAASTPNVTFNKDVLPVLQKKCQSCHRPGEVAPMSFLSYKETRPWAKAIKAATLTRKMPPWFADEKVGRFKNALNLTEAELAAISAWADNGAPEGDEKDKPAPVRFADGWSLGQPDIVVEMEKDVPIPATGIVDVKSVFVKVNFPEDVWVEAAEIRPSNRAVVHHMKAWVVLPGSSAQSTYGQRNGDDMIGGGGGREILAKYNPGLGAQYFTVGDAAKFIPKGSDIMFETHYTSNGTATTDRSKVGIKLAKHQPKRRFYTTGALTNHSFTIPAGHANYELRTSVTIDQPNVEITWIQPHMHMRGKAYEVRAIYPTGESETLLRVPKYDFNWQVGYEFEKPVPLPQGTRLESVAVFDNSANNPFNPDPARDVPYGGQTWDEMSVAFFSVVVNRDVNPASLFPRTARRAAAKKAAAE